jgi:hypothetical protein
MGVALDDLQLTQKECHNELLEQMYNKLDDFISSLGIQKRDPFRKAHLIQVLHKAQEIFGY